MDYLKKRNSKKKIAFFHAICRHILLERKTKLSTLSPKVRGEIDLAGILGRDFDSWVLPQGQKFDIKVVHFGSLSS